MRSRKTRLVLFTAVTAALVGGVAALVACGAQAFDPQSVVDSVRLFAVRADKPYTLPGETVTLEALFTDARKVKTRPLKLYWIPLVCVNPREDLYYACFVPGDGGVSSTRIISVGPLADAGAGAPGAGAPGASDAGTTGGGSPFAQIPTGVDLGPLLPQGPKFSFRMPDDVVQPRQGSDPYGLAIVFNVACAGRVEFAPRDPSAGPQQVPVLCTDEDGKKLPPSDYVIGISRVYSYPTRANTNPVIEKVTLDGVDVDLATGITVDRCTEAKTIDCKELKIDVRISDASWELNQSPGSDGLREQIWVDYYASRGELGNDARLLFDTRLGRVTESENKYRAPKDLGDGSMWLVVHDNRGGASWVIVPIHVK